MLKDYVDLIERVRLIDQEAAEFLRGGVCRCDNVQFSGVLSGCFIWAKTPQGHRYWEDIEQKLDRSNSNEEKYQELIEKVKKISPFAADYLKEKAINLPEFEYDSELSGCFYWDDTPQGHDYWKIIDKILCGEFNANI